MAIEKVFWADGIAAEAKARSSQNCICTGITPSGEIHIGNMREVLSGEAVYRALGENARFIFLGDSYDALRRVYPFLDPARYAAYVGKPLSDIPCPCGRHESYAAHFLEPFVESLRVLGVNAEILLAHELYAKGLYTAAIFTALEKQSEIAAILHDVTGKEIRPEWSPVHPKCAKCGKITDARVLSYNCADASIDYACACGHTGSANAAQGGAKLTWRVDWPARWKILNVTVEPFGKDHASRGGSYDTGKRIASEIFDYEAPLPLVYEWISLKGQGDMSSSKGNVISVADMARAVPPDVLRYMIFRAQPKKALVFDPGLPLLNLIDELDDPESKICDARAAECALLAGMHRVGIPYKHLVNIAQIAGESDEEALRIIARGGYAIQDAQAIRERLQYARTWLERYAPEDLKFSGQERLPEEARLLSPAAKSALLYLANKFTDDMDANALHGLFYEAQAECNIPAQEIFEAFYLAMIGKKRGPRAGWFIQIMGVAPVRARLLEAATAT
ncbi:MAG: lysine--tRNA ligase [Spirochaetota bacterium]|nr:lysine--tRNA ligase [Spirochaetota bacterium]